MGCDGGTIPKRDELVRTKKKPEQVDKDAENVAKWKHCAINQEELRMPIVSCELGRLYNKDTVIEYLLGKTAVTDNAVHIRNLKDLVELKLSLNPSYKKSKIDKGDEYVDRQAAEYVCPVTGLEMNGKHRFCCIRTCGCVLSERSLKEIKADVCHKCGQKYNDDDVVVINGTPEDVELLKARMEERRLRIKMEKKAKKETKKQKLEETGETSKGTAAKKSKLEGETSASKRGEASSSKTNATDIRNMVMTEEKLKQSYTVSKDPKASEAFKSLFTSHDSCKQQPRAHWVTYNPLYY